MEDRQSASRSWPLALLALAFIIGCLGVTAWVLRGFIGGGEGKDSVVVIGSQSGQGPTADVAHPVMPGTATGRATTGPAIAPRVLRRTPAGPDLVFDIPRMENLRVDGNPGSWGDGGLKVQVMLGDDATALARKEFDPRFRMAWNERGLFVLGEVREAPIRSSENMEDVFSASGMEIIVTDKRTTANHLVVYLRPSLSATPTSPKVYWVHSPPRAPAGQDQIVASSVGTSDGYVIEAMFPWSDLAFAANNQRLLGVQVNFFHPSADGSNTSYVYWYPSNASWRLPAMTYAVRRAETASPAVVCAVRPDASKGMDKLYLKAIGTPDLAGQTAELRTRTDAVLPKGTVSDATFAADGDRTSAAWSFDNPPPSATVAPDFDLLYQGQDIALAPNLNPLDRAQQAIDGVWLAGQFVFEGAQFPKLGWQTPGLARGVFGTDALSFKYFNEQYNPVTSADRPGRYGVVAEFTLPDGSVSRRFATVCRVADGAANSKSLPALPATTFPRSKHFDTQLTAATATPTNSDWAIYMADALSGQPEGDPWLADQAWWVGLRRKLYGFDQKYPATMMAAVAPYGADPPATELRMGTAEEAGMDPAIVDQIDALCRQGSAQFPNEGLSFCIARNGVVFFNRAYGKLDDGSAMTVDTPTETTSIGTIVTGTIAMMLEEHKLFDPEEPVADLSAPFGRVRAKTTVTFRDFFSHLSGLSPLNQSAAPYEEEEVADLAPYLRAKTAIYSPDGYEMIGSVIEDMYGEPIFKLEKRLVFDPLGEPGAEQAFAAGSAQLTAMEQAKLGQIMLNQGAYGKVRWMSPATFQKMLPVAQWGARGGIGVELVGNGPLARNSVLPVNTLGHSTGHSGVFKVLPDQKMVIIIGGMKYGVRDFGNAYDEKIFAALLAGIRN